MAPTADENMVDLSTAQSNLIESQDTGNQKMDVSEELKKTSSSILQCEICYHRFGGSDSKRALEYHTSRKRCANCGENFGCLSELCVHKKYGRCKRSVYLTIADQKKKNDEDETNSSEVILSCKICSKTFTKIASLRIHQTTCTIDGEGVLESFPCNYCKSMMQLPKFSTIQERCCVRCDSVIKARVLAENQIVSGEKDLSTKTCNLCGDNYMSAKSHLHFKGKKTLCKTCNMQFPCHGLCKAHQRNCEFSMGLEIIPNLSLKKCSLCEDVYKSAKPHLHFQGIKTRCKMCNKKFPCHGLCNAHQKKCAFSMGLEIIPRGERNKISSSAMVQKHPTPKHEKCVHCSFSSISAEDLKNHRSAAKCPNWANCGIFMACSTFLAQHMATCCLPEDVSKSSQNVSEASPLSLHEPACSRKFMCKECDEGFDEVSEFRTHKAVHKSRREKDKIVELLSQEKYDYNLSFVASFIVDELVKKEKVDNNDFIDSEDES